MSRKHSKHELARVWPAVAIMAIWLAGTAGGVAAEPAVSPGKPADFTAVAADTAVLLDEDTVWRHLHLEGPSFFLLDDPKVTSLSGVQNSQVRRTQCVQTAAGTMAKVGLRYALGAGSLGAGSDHGK